MEPLAGITNSRYAVVTQTSDTGRTEGQPSSGAGSTAEPTTATGIKLPEDKVTLSGRQPVKDQADTSPAETETSKSEPKPGEKTTAAGQSVEDPQIEQQVSRLKQIEEKVKAHEAAHKAVGGNLASSASYSYTQGPDGHSYITGGEVQIDMSTGRTPEETVSRMQQVIRAALAPADPSGQDRAVAAQAASQMAQAQQEKTQAAGAAAEQESGQPVDPARESGQQAADPVSNNSSNGIDSRVQQAYGNPAVQGTGGYTTDQPGTSVTSSSTRQQAGSSQTSGNSLISSFA